ncbi:MAG: hypothetical protein IJV46_09650 [Acidaminococcaceae bacterium]|nr:hypothetical protein [Acidaminococcaceae bacterium]
MTSEKKKFYQVKEVRQIVFNNQISLGTIMNLVHKGEIPTIRMMSRYLIPAYWVEQQLAISRGEKVAQ